jgi:TM2 domain-containing membrane protein YozV
MNSSEYGENSSKSEVNSKKISAGICGILLGALGIHKFILGYRREGTTMLIISIVGSIFLFAGPLVMGLIGLIEGILYLTKSDQEFDRTYISGRKGWF